MGHVWENWPKKIHGKFHVSVWLKIQQEFEQGKYKFERCRSCNAQIILNDAEAEVRGVKALGAHANSLAHPRAKLYPNQSREGITETKTKRGRDTNES
jgi:hypothetical protein